MSQEAGDVKKVGLVFGTLPTVEEIDQFMLLHEGCEITVLSSESICGFLTQTTRFQQLKMIALPDYERDNTSFLPGLERVLQEFEMVVVKERTGLYAYQVVKAKWQHQFRLVVWVDNGNPFPGQDIDQMRTVRNELSNAADAFLVQSKVAKDALLIEGIEEERIQLIDPWVGQRAPRSPESALKAKEALGLDEDTFVLGYFGQVEWEEGLLNLIHGVKAAIDKDTWLAKNLKVIVSGIGSLAADFRERAITLGIDDRFIYLAPGRDEESAVLSAASAIYVGSVQSRDRLEADPFRILTAMSHGIPIVASRSPLVQEFVDKHRIDFCAGSIQSLSQALVKCWRAKSLVKDLVNKNLEKIESKFAKDRIAQMWQGFLAENLSNKIEIAEGEVDKMIRQVESMVSGKQYLAAIDTIQTIFNQEDLAEHLKSKLFRLIGDCFTKLGDKESGKDAYMQSIELDPYSFKSYIGLGTVSLMKMNYDMAVIHFQKAVSLAHNDEMANLGLGLAFQGLDELQEALRWVSKALEINPENRSALLTLVRIAQECEDFEVAEKHLCANVARHPSDHELIYMHAELLQKLGRYDEVLEALSTIVSVDPLNVRAQSLIKQAKRARNRNVASSVG